MAHPVFSAFGTMPRNAYPPQYYPNSPELTSAQPLELKPGQEAEADFTLHPAATSTISGVVAGVIQSGLSISYQGADGQDSSGNYFRFDPRTGRFALGMVPSGSWTLRFTSSDAKGNAYYAEQNIEANGTDVSGLQIVLQPTAAIPVIVNRAPAMASASQNTSPHRPIKAQECRFDWFQQITPAMSAFMPLPAPAILKERYSFKAFTQGTIRS